MPGIPAEMLDFTIFTKLSGPARMAYLFSKIDVAGIGLDVDSIRAAIRSIKFDPHTVEADAAIASCVDDLDNLDSTRADLAASSGAEQSLQDFIAELVVAFDKRRHRGQTLTGWSKRP